MKAFALAALLLGVVAARVKLMGYSNELTPRIITGSNGIFDIQYTYNFETTYGVKFNAEVDSTDSDINKESYALNMDAYIDIDFELNFLGLYKQNIGVTFDILDITPYRQVVSYVNPEALLWGSKTNLDVTLSGEYDLFFGEITTTSTMHMLEVSKSIVDLAIAGSSIVDYIPMMSDFAVNADGIETTETYLSWSAASLVDPSGTWYGNQEYWTMTWTLI